MSDDDQLPQDSGSTFGHIRPDTPIPWQAAYRAYFDHSAGCDACGHGWTRCGIAKGLWRTYKDARENRR